MMKEELELGHLFIKGCLIVEGYFRHWHQRQINELARKIFQKYFDDFDEAANYFGE